MISVQFGIFDQKTLIKMVVYIAILVAGLIIGFAALALAVSFTVHLGLNLLFQAFAEVDHAGLLMQMLLLWFIWSVLRSGFKFVIRAVRSFRAWQSEV
jgi:hypothetical protein